MQENSTNIPVGYCQCGCGQHTLPYKQTDKRHDALQGQPGRYLSGHNFLSSLPEYIEEDRGFSSACWIWQRARTCDGYGNTCNGYAHRVYYEREHGSTPSGYEHHHRCEVRACVRPSHLMRVTHKQNIRLQRNTKLTPEIAARVRRIREETNLSYGKLARAFGVTRPTIYKIVKGRTWLD